VTGAHAAATNPADQEETPSTQPLHVGFLHLGRRESGVRRYGRILAEEARRRGDLRTTQIDAGLLEGRSGGMTDRGRALAGVDVVHLQWNRRGWGRGPRSAQRFIDFRRFCRRPLVVTLHDVFPREGLRERWLAYEVLALRLVGRSASRIVVHSEQEVARLEGIVPTSRVRVIPHFVEERHIALTSAAARQQLGVEGRRVVTLLGFIYGRKGHKILVEAVPALAPDVQVVYAGGPIVRREKTLEIVEQRKQELNLGEERLRITGYLSEDDLETWVAATDLAVLPFRDLSASGSLSTWIAAGKPILASDLPGFREYDARVPGSLRLFSPIEPGPLADAITAQLATDLPEIDPRVVALREDLTVERTVGRYATVYREALGEARRTSMPRLAGVMR
jgi:glycosyltransferase involved in cell wall biosynthesis